MDPYGGYNPHQPGDDFTTTYRPLPPLPAHLHRIYHSNPPSPDPAPAPRPISSSAGSTPAADSDKASPNLNGNPLPPPTATASANNSAKKRDRGRAAERSEAGSSRVQSPANNGGAVGQEDATTKEGKAPAKRAKVGARASIACICCRKRKVRCSGEWPTCKFCEGRSIPCVYEGHPAEHGGPANPVSAAFGVGGLLSPSIDPILPPEATILAATDIFFLHNYDTFYFLHRPTLIESVKNGSAPKELVCCILAFAARFSQPLRELHPSSLTAASEHYAALATQVLSNPSTASGKASTSAQPASDPEISLIRCQCFLMLGLYECTASQENKGWLKIGYAIRMAQVLRLGFEDEDEGAGARVPPKDPLRSEIRRRTFWACFLLDRTVSDGKERPCSLKPPLPSALRMPSSDADFLASRPSQGARFDPDPPKWSLSAKTESVGKEPEADLYGLTLRVAEIWQRVATYIGSGGRNIDRRAPWLPESTFATLQRDLTTFDERLPAEQKYTESNLLAHNLIGQGRLFGMLHLLFSTSRLVLHRDYLPFLPPPNFKAGDGPVDGEPLCGEPVAPAGWWQTSFNHAAQASGTVADILGSTAGHGAMITHPFAGFAALASLTIHLHLKYWPQSSDTPVNNAFHIEQTTSILTALRDVYPIAAGWCDGMAKLQLLYYNLVRGVLDVDPAKVRASVVQLLRTVKEEDHSHSPTRPAVVTTTNAIPHLTNNASNPAGPQLLNPLNNNADVFAPPFPRTSSAPHNPSLGGTPALHSPLDLNTEFDFLLPAPGMDPFDLWGTGANGGWTDLNLLSSVDSAWGPAGGPGMWHQGGHAGQYYG